MYVWADALALRVFSCGDGILGLMDFLWTDFLLTAFVALLRGRTERGRGQLTVCDMP